MLVLTPSEGDRIITEHVTGGSVTQGEQANNSSQAYGSGPDLTALLRTMTTEGPPSDFGPGEAGLPDEMPDDFGFLLRYGIGRGSIIDTFTDTYIHGTLAGPTTELPFPPEELESLYRRMVEIGIEDYPSDFQPPATGGTTPGADMHESYRFRLRADGRWLEIDWDDVYWSTVPEATALRQLLQDIVRMIMSRGVYQKLPKPVTEIS